MAVHDHNQERDDGGNYPGEGMEFEFPVHYKLILPTEENQRRQAFSNVLHSLLAAFGNSPVHWEPDRGNPENVEVLSDLINLAEQNPIEPSVKNQLWDSTGRWQVKLSENSDVLIVGSQSKKLLEPLKRADLKFK